MSYEDLGKTEYLPFAESVELIKNRQLDATLSLPALVSPRSATLRPPSRSSGGGPEDVAEALGAPYVATTIPASTYEGQDEDVPTVAVVNFLVTHADVSRRARLSDDEAAVREPSGTVAAHKAAKAYQAGRCAEGHADPAASRRGALLQGKGRAVSRVNWPPDMTVPAPDGPPGLRACTHRSPRQARHQSQPNPSSAYTFRWRRGFPRHLKGRLLFWIAVAFSVFQLATAAHLVDLPSQVVRAVHVGFLLLLAFPLFALAQASRPGAEGARLGRSALSASRWPSINGIITSLCACGRAIRSARYRHRRVALARALLGCWRIMGPALPIICGPFLAYGLFGEYLPAPLDHRGYGFAQIIDQMSFGTEGIYGTPTYVSATYIFLFILFGAFLEQAGMIQLFTDVSHGPGRPHAGRAGQGRGHLVRR